MKCRHCGSDITLSLIDLGSAPPSNAYLSKVTLRRPEKWFPLKVMVCDNCWLVQAEVYSRSAELFNDEYAYFSSFSQYWLDHSERYVSKMAEFLGLNENSYVVEVASNDGYLLQYMQKQRIPCLGIEPTASTAAASKSKGIETIEEFFDTNLARRLVKEGKQADLMVANNVLAHVPDINDFAAGFATLLKPEGVATFEFPHLVNLIGQIQFDTIYHEHFSYLSFTTVVKIFQSQGLCVFDVEELDTHGGSLRVFAQRSDTKFYAVSPRVGEFLYHESRVGINNANYYEGFQAKADGIARDFLFFLLEAKRQDKKVVGYGAAAKGNTLMNYAGVRPNLIPFVVDRNPAKQDRFMPGSRIPIVDEGKLQSFRPDYIVILPWNLKSEIMKQLDYARGWGAKFVTAVPSLEVV
ncbi:class I SAM-dependent methyltransferase [Cylindrospermopsis raciborskii]|uniref:class I SAM-dependent methyltransferase n=1 Tax=Cylindrospermopsis raciborskii TaxID=77022 RepID=UPI0008DDE998|nr:class I SAM-dependent methyltransferase [Cylindrospermopsis raciborskii]NLQ05636.1 class I SAM-dependent methyltransferase [Cylindrospermopsis raciborskii MVCC19]OHY34208.1 SAM-dependent methyltransferase [Cylindrospermopsis raciborskii MVCC14]